MGVTMQYSDRPSHLVQVCQYLFVSETKGGQLFVLDIGTAGRRDDGRSLSCCVAGDGSRSGGRAGGSVAASQRHSAFPDTERTRGPDNDTGQPCGPR